MMLLLTICPRRTHQAGGVLYRHSAPEARESTCLLTINKVSSMQMALKHNADGIILVKMRVRTASRIGPLPMLAAQLQRPWS